MKICIFGAGAVAGLAAARMARALVLKASAWWRAATTLTAIQRSTVLTVRDRDGELDRADHGNRRHRPRSAFRTS